ncbi:MAG TPA: hypothetical protein PLV83_05410, partial [Bacilli bacterium]|nr:hypothetical protein [Bacilli bacterium]
LVSLSDFNDMKAQYEAQIAQLQSTSNITIKSHNTYSQSSTPWSNSQTLTLTSENNKEYMLIVYATAINSGEPTRSENITLTLSGCTTKEVIRNDNNIKIYKVKANSNEISILFSYATSNVIRLEAELI